MTQLSDTNFKHPQLISSRNKAKKCYENQNFLIERKKQRNKEIAELNVSN